MREREREGAREREYWRWRGVLREGSAITREAMEMNLKQERKLREMKENAGQVLMENEESMRVREKCSREKSEEKGQEQE